MPSKKQRLRGLKASLTLQSLDSFPMTLGSETSNAGEETTRGNMPGSDWDRELALAEQARREAIYEARDAEGDRPSALPEPRAPLETLPEGSRVSWPRVLLAVAAAVSAAAGAVHEWLSKP